MPPNLDVPREHPTSRRNSCFHDVLDYLAGHACLLDPGGTIEAAGTNWDELASRIGRPELSREQIVAHPLWQLLPTEEQRAELRSLLASLSDSSNMKAGTFTADFSTPDRICVLTLHLQVLREEGRLTGYFVQATDATAEHVSRTALLDRERRLREIRASVEKQSDEIAALRKQLETVASRRDHTAGAVLHAFESEHSDFASAVCRLGAEAGNALFATLAIYSSETQKLRFSAQHNAPDFHRYVTETGSVELALGEGPAGIAAERGCPTAFDHLLSREDFKPWAELARQYGYNCIWAFPLEDEHGLCGVLQLYYADEEVALPVEACAALTQICQLSAPLLRTSEAWNARSAPSTEKPLAFRVLASWLAEEFANLLTGVLGHSSLIAAEMGEGHAALEDVHAVEKAARGAARLTRKLTALCGNVHHGLAPLDVSSYLHNYVHRDRASFFPAGPANLEAAAHCGSVSVEGPSLEIMLDGMAEHARTVGGSDLPTWSLQAHDGQVKIALTYRGTASLPAEWSGETWSAHARTSASDLLFAREAARAAGGELAVEEQAEHTVLRLTLPLASQSASRETS